MSTTSSLHSFFFYALSQKNKQKTTTHRSVHLSATHLSPSSLPHVSPVPRLLVLTVTVSMWAGNITKPNEGVRVPPPFFSLFFSFNVVLRSVSSCLLISRGTGVLELKDKCTRSFSSSYKRFWWHSIIYTLQQCRKEELTPEQTSFCWVRFLLLLFLLLGTLSILEPDKVLKFSHLCCV